MISRETGAVAALPMAEEVLESAYQEHPEYADFDADFLHGMVDQALTRIALFNASGRSPLHVTEEDAANIGTIWVLSGTGSYDSRFKPQDNPKLIEKPWMGGWDRARLSRGALLARKIAEARSGVSLESGAPSDIDRRKQQTRELIAEYGPELVYNGYPCEMDNLEQLLERPGIIIPREKVTILHGEELKITADQVRTFRYPDVPGIQDKEVAIVSHAAHLGARVLHMLEHYKPLGEGRVPYMSPIAMPAEGLHEAATMEPRGLLFYALLADPAVAATEPHPYQLLQQPERMQD